MTANFKEMRLPIEISARMVGGPMWNTRVIPLDNGNEFRIAVWQYPLHKFDCGAALREVQNAIDTKRFFFRSQGMAYGFRVLDPFDQSADVGEGNATLVSTGIYQMVKDYLVDGDLFRRTIAKPIPGTCVVFVDNGMGPVVASSSTVDYTRGLISAISPTPTIDTVVSWVGMFDTPVRFTTDALQIGQDPAGLLNWNGATIQEVRKSYPSVGTPPTFTQTVF